MNDKINNSKYKLKNIHYLHWGIIASSLLLTIVAWYISSSQAEKNIEQKFNFDSHQLISLISERMSHYEDALKSSIAAIQLNDNKIDAEKWRKYSKTLTLEQDYPGINGIGIVYRIIPKNLDNFLEEQRRYRPQFSIKPMVDRPEYWPITYTEPESENRQALGLDMAFEENRFNAAKLARDTGTTQITAPIILVQDKKRTPGFLKFTPFYSKNNLANLAERQQHFIGHVYAPFIMSKLMEGTLEQKNRHLLFSIHDKHTMLYDELTTNTANFDEQPLFTKNVTVDMYGRPWKYTIQTGQSFREITKTQQPQLILIGGLVIDSLLFIIFLMLSRSNEQALNLVDKISNDYEKDQNYFHHIINSAPCGIAIINEQGYFENINIQMTMLFGYSEEEFKYINTDVLVPERYKTGHKKLLENLVKNEKNFRPRLGQGQAVHALTKEGKEFPAEIGIASITHKNDSKTIITIIDMTEYTQVTNELKRSNKDLDQFAYIASHDLKAPLRGITQLATWIEEDVIDSANEETKENLLLLKNRCERLNKLLDDLFDYSRIGRRKNDIKLIDVRSTIINILELIDHQQCMRLNFVGNMPTFKTYATPLEVIFRNLISNAIKHHHKDKGIIEIECKEFDQHYEFSFSDDGPGISPMHHQKIFKLFTTLKPRDEVEGSGMGLSIINKILLSLEQTIDVFSDGSNGTTFNFTWPKTTKGANE